MVSIPSLWLPILLSAVIVFFVSWIVHMLLPYHRTDFGKLPSETQAQEALRKLGIPPGDYMVPCAGGPGDMKKPEFLDMVNQGPVVVMTVMKPGPFRMGQSLVQWFVYCLIVSVFAAYIASRAVEPGGSYLRVFRFAGATAFFCYAIALWQDSIWHGRKWSTTAKSSFDGLVYGLMTAGTFGWLWPR